MNIHSFVDNLSVWVGALVTGEEKFFSNNIDSRPFKELIQETEVTIPSINGAGTFELEGKSPIGEISPAFKVEKWLGNDVPTIIYHHGNNENPIDDKSGSKDSFFNIFVKSIDEYHANIIVVRAPFHNISTKEYQYALGDLLNFMAMISASVKVNELIIRELRKQNSKPIITGGISLGGWVTNLHRSFFNSSTAYVPLLAGTFLAELFIQSKYQKMTGEKALDESGTLRELLNFNTDFEKITDKNVFPLLSIYDQYIEYEIQKESYNGYSVQTLEAGHITGLLKAEQLRNHLIKVLSEIT